MTSEHVWNKPCYAWINIYQGPPDYIITDAGKNFISKNFVQNASALTIKTKAVPIEAHWSIGMVERYHLMLRRTYEIVCQHMAGTKLNKNMLLQIAVKAVNDSAGPDGLVPTLLVYGAYPKMTELDPPSPNIAQRAIAIQKAMEEVGKLHASRQVNEALNTRNGPSTAPFYDLPINSNVFVWCEGNMNRNGQWTGPYPLLGVNDEICSVKLPSGPTNFFSTSVKPYMHDDFLEDNQNTTIPREEASTNQSIPQTPSQIIPDSIPQHPGTPPPTTKPRRILRSSLRSRIRTNLTQIKKQYNFNNNPDLTFTYNPHETTSHPSKFSVNHEPSFVKSKRREISGLLEKGTFKIVELVDIPSKTRIFKSRFINEIKHPGTSKAFEKSRFVIQGYDDEGKSMILTQAPTIQRSS